MVFRYKTFASRNRLHYMKPHEDYKESNINPESERFAKSYAEKTGDLIMNTLKAFGQEAEETEQMVRSFFRMLEAKLNLSERSQPPNREEVEAAIEQLKDVGRFSIFSTLVFIPGGVISLVGLELLARRFGIRGFTLVPSSFRKRKKRSRPGDAAQ
jgi:hypothetical protein